MLDAVASALRLGAAVTRMEHVHALGLSGSGAFDLLDRLTTSRLFVREGQMLQTLLLDEESRILADVFLGADEEGWILLAEGPSRADLLAHVEHVRGRGTEVTVNDLLAGHELWSLDGPYAWELGSALLGPELLGTPYLSFLRLRGVTCFRAGKTGEYGYLLLVPRGEAGGLWRELRGLGRAVGLVDASVAALDQCALENFHFTIRALAGCRAATLTPAELQLRWRLDPSKDFVGARALRARARGEVAQRVTCFVARGPVVPEQPVELDAETVGWVLQGGWSAIRGEWVGWAMLDAPLAWPGIRRFHVAGMDGPVPIRTVSPPLLDNRSLFVDPRRHRFATQAEQDFPPLVRR